MILPCLHRFHCECIKEWFKRRNTCPNCKDRVTDHFENAERPSSNRNEEHHFFFEEEEDENEALNDRVP